MVIILLLFYIVMFVSKKTSKQLNKGLLVIEILMDVINYIILFAL